MNRYACRLCSGRTVASLLCGIGLMLGPWVVSGVAGTINSGAVIFNNNSGLTEAGATSGSVSTTGDITTAQAFRFTNVANSSTVGNPAAEYFVGLGSGAMNFASVAFGFSSDGVNTTASLSDSLFGSFQSSFAVQVANSATDLQKTRIFEVFGTYTNGTIAQQPFPSESGQRGNTNPFPVGAVWRITLSQNVGANQTIAFSSTFSFPAAVPEPGTSTLAVVGITALAAVHLSRRRRSKAPTESPTT